MKTKNKSPLKDDNEKDWKKYEEYFFETLRSKYPHSKIQFNQYIDGVFSKTKRQVDILVTDEVCGVGVSIAFDCKYYSKHLHVKHVESIIGMIQDLAVTKGVIVTNKGFSDAALNRVKNDPNCSLSLEIIKLEELIPFSEYVALMHRGQYCAVLTAPSGWKVTPSSDPVNSSVLGFIHPQEIQLIAESNFLGQKPPYIYCNISLRDKHNENIVEDLLQQQETSTRLGVPESIFTYWEKTSDSGFKIFFRRIDYVYFPIIEHSVFINLGGDAVFYLVLVDSSGTDTTSYKYLEYLVQHAAFFKKTGSEVNHQNANICIEELLSYPNNHNFEYIKIMPQSISEIDGEINFSEDAKMLSQIDLPTRRGMKLAWKNLVFVRNANYWSIKRLSNPKGHNLAKFLIRNNNEYIFGLSTKLNSSHVDALLKTFEKKSRESVRENFGGYLDIRSTGEDHLYEWYRFIGDESFNSLCLGIYSAIESN